MCKQHDEAEGLFTANIFTDLVFLRLASDGSLADHLNTFRTLHNDLQSNLASTPYISISKALIAILFIISLPSQYAPLVQSLLINFNTILLARLYSLLKIDSLRNSATVKSETTLMTSKSNQVKKKKKKSPGKQATPDTLTCSLGHPGHNDEGCKTQRWNEFMEYDKAKKNKNASPNSPNLRNSQMNRQIIKTILSFHTMMKHSRHPPVQLVTSSTRELPSICS